MSERKGTRALELWCKRIVNVYPNVNVENMTTSWRNGLAFCALVHHFRPDVIDFQSLKPEDIYGNNELAFRVAEKHLGIPALLDPEDMVNSQVPDRLSILTYLSQFYQRLGSTSVCKPTSAGDVEPNAKPIPSPRHSIPNKVQTKIGKADYESCTACGLPVYLAQRLLVSHKLYHRRCFRCSKCNAQLSPGSCYEDSEIITCDSCQNDDLLPKLLPEDDDKMGMIMYEDNLTKENSPSPEPGVYRRTLSKPLSVSDRISAFENLDFKPKRISFETRFSNLAVDVVDGKTDERNENVNIEKSLCDDTKKVEQMKTNQVSNDNKDFSTCENIDTAEVDKSSQAGDILSDSSFKVNRDKLNFLQTQLAAEDESLCSDEDLSRLSYDAVSANSSTPKSIKSIYKIDENDNSIDSERKIVNNVKHKDNNDKYESVVNLPDDERINVEPDSAEVNIELVERESPFCETRKLPPPRRKTLQQNKKTDQKEDSKALFRATEGLYPKELNPFSEDEEEANAIELCTKEKSISTNPFGSSDEEQDENDAPHWKVESVPKVEISNQNDSKASNPFWSDGEEPSQDEEEIKRITKSINKTNSEDSKSRIKAVRRRKPPAPPPPLSARITPLSKSTATLDSLSVCSDSSHCSYIANDLNSTRSVTPSCRKKSPAPLTPDSASLISHASSETLDRSDESHSTSKRKGPAPGLPLPARRVVRPLLAPEELASELELLEVQQQGLERQGVTLERTIREKCEGDNTECPPQEEIEELVIQLCELVNEKNDLFRRQAELMYIRRQQRLEQEQADIEHEIRVLQSRPAVNRIDADKAREEYLVARLVAIVKARDALVQAQDMERQRQWNEDVALAKSIAAARAKRNSTDAATATTANKEKKSKVKDRVKKQIKKAKTTLNPKKKSDKKGEKSGSSSNVSQVGETSSKNGKPGKAKWF